MPTARPFLASEGLYAKTLALPLLSLAHLAVTKIDIHAQQRGLFDLFAPLRHQSGRPGRCCFLHLCMRVCTCYFSSCQQWSLTWILESTIHTAFLHVHLHVQSDTTQTQTQTQTQTHTQRLTPTQTREHIPMGGKNSSTCIASPLPWSLAALRWRHLHICVLALRVCIVGLCMRAIGQCVCVCVCVCVCARARARVCICCPLTPLPAPFLSLAVFLSHFDSLLRTRTEVKIELTAPRMQIAFP